LAQEASKMPLRKIQTRLICLLSAAALALVSCGKLSIDSNAELSDPTEGLPARFKTQEAVPKPDFSVAAQSAAFQQAIKDVAALLGSEPKPLRSPAEDEEVVGGVSFDVSQKKIEAELRKAHTDFLARGFYLFRYEQNFALNETDDKVGLLPTTDPYAVMAAMDTNGDNYNIGTAGVIAWMKELQQEQPFILTGIGYDYMEGHFISSPKDPEALATRMYQFCPDIVDQGAGSISALASELEKGAIYFWWD
jgi:hypothetical protein